MKENPIRDCMKNEMGEKSVIANEMGFGSECRVEVRCKGIDLI
jgi:hypothetical protein